MKSKLVFLSKKPFIRNVIIMASGSAAAQAITVALSPIITRLYGPEAFGLLGVFTAIIGMVTPIAALTYPVAMVLPKKDLEARKLGQLSVYLSTIVALFLLGILFFFNNQITDLFSISEISIYLYLIPLVIILSANLQTIQQWLVRTKQFKVTAQTAIYQSLFTNLSKIGIGLFFPFAVSLILMQVLGIVMRSLLMTLLSDKSYIKNVNMDEEYKLKKLMISYKDFPLYRAPQVFINAFSQKLPIFLLTVFFGPAAAGFYLIGTTTLGTATELIGKSVQNVFYPKVSEAATKKENISNLLKQAIVGLLIIGLIPFSVVIIWGPEIFGFVFGREWSKAGEYAQWIALMSYSTLITRPVIATIPVLQFQKGFLLFEIISTLAKVGALGVGFYYFQNDVYAVALFSITALVMYIILTGYTLREAKAFDKKSGIISD